MRLLYQTHSPYARKVLVAAHEAGLADQIEVLHRETSPTRRNEEVFRFNPLGKVPVLITEAGEALFDSDVICSYLDTLTDSIDLVPRDDEGRWRALQWQALAQGMNDAGIAVRWETVRRPEALRYPPLQAGYTEKLVAAYDWLEERVSSFGDLNIGHIAVATSLSWLEFRDLPTFRQGRPNLSAWLDRFEARPSMKATTLHGDTHD